MVNEGQFRVMSDHGQRQVISCHVCNVYLQSNPYFFGFYYLLFCSHLWASWLCISAPRVTSLSSPVCPFSLGDEDATTVGIECSVSLFLLF